MAEFRTIDGNGNNQANPTLGQSNTELVRLFQDENGNDIVFYEDGIGEARVTGPSGIPLPNERTISNIVVDQENDSDGNGILTPNFLGASDWLWQWGQVIDHDLDLNEGSPDEEPEFFTIPVPDGDPVFEFDELFLIRVPAAEGTGTDENNPRAQVNLLTHFIDGSQVYGSDEDTASALRTFEGGKLKSQTVTFTQTDENGNTIEVTEELLPFLGETVTDALPDGVAVAASRDGADPETFFAAGDPRPNENQGLTAIHTLLVREHNYIVEELAEELEEGNQALEEKFTESGLTEDEYLYQAARKVVSAEIQQITYNEFLPLLIGSEFTAIDGVLGSGYGIAPYEGYEADIDPSVSVEFANAAYRIGHTLLADTIQRINAEGQSLGGLFLGDTFFNPTEIYDETAGTGTGVDAFYLGLSSQEAQEVDNVIVDGVRNFLADIPTAGFDLAAINLGRSRETGLPTLNEARELLGLNPHTDYSDLTSNSDVAALFEQAYGEGNIDDVELWVGGISEDAVNGGLLGETLNVIISDQFQRTRDGDRFFYLEQEQLSHLEDLEEILDYEILDTTLSDVIERNSSVEIEGSAFLVFDEEPEDILLFGSPEPDTIELADSANTQLIFAGAAEDLIDGIPSNSFAQDRIYGGIDNDEILLGTNDRAFGGDGDDILDANASNSGNRLYGGDGNDELIASTNSRLFGGEGNDTLDSSLGSGDNRLYGGDGNDDFILGSGDRAIGGEGNDRFFVQTGGDNIITGGEDADDFHVATSGTLPEQPNVITDFDPFEDRIILGGDFGDTIFNTVEEEGGTYIVANGEQIAFLDEVTDFSVDEIILL